MVKTARIMTIRLIVIAILLAYAFGFVPRAKADEIRNLIPHVIIAESRGNPSAVSRDNCIGLMGVSHYVLREFNQHNRKRLSKGKRKKRSKKSNQYSFKDLYDPEANVEIGTWYLKRLRDHYIPEDKYSIEVLLACYNAGPTRMRKLRYDWKRAPYETRHYVRKIMRLLDNTTQ